MPAAILIIFITRQRDLILLDEPSNSLCKGAEKGDVGSGISIEGDGKTMVSEGAGKKLRMLLRTYHRARPGKIRENLFPFIKRHYAFTLGSSSDKQLYYLL